MDLLLAKKFHEKSYPGENVSVKKTYPQINVCSLREKKKRIADIVTKIKIVIKPVLIQ